MDWQPWLKLLHIAAGFTFALAHGVSAFTVIKLRGERDPSRVTALLDLSKMSLPVTDAAIVVLLVSGVISGFVGSYWGHLWIWIAIGVLILLFAFMSLRGVKYHDAIRHGLGLPGFYDHKGATVPNADPAALAEALDAPRGLELAAVGGIGLLVLLWLMVIKPF